MLMSLLFDAAVLGLLVAWILDDGFPGWPVTIGVVIGIGIPHLLVILVLGGGFWPLGLVASAVTLFGLARWLWGLDDRQGIRLTIWYFVILFAVNSMWSALT